MGCLGMVEALSLNDELCPRLIIRLDFEISKLVEVLFIAQHLQDRVQAFGGVAGGCGLLICGLQ